MHSARPDINSPPMLRWSGCEGTTDMRPSLFVGAYTAVTKSLWQKALQSRGTPSKDAPLPAIVNKEPQVTSVQYPFTQDREFYEMVSALCPHRHCFFYIALVPFLLFTNIERALYVHFMYFIGSLIPSAAAAVKLYQHENTDPQKMAKPAFRLPTRAIMNCTTCMYVVTSAQSFSESDSRGEAKGIHLLNVLHA